LLAATLNKGNHDRNHKLWNILSTDRYKLHMQVLWNILSTDRYKLHMQVLWNVATSEMKVAFEEKLRKLGPPPSRVQGEKLLGFEHFKTHFE
jgi:nicotinic acid phosphoribosyltransferase